MATDAEVGHAGKTCEECGSPLPLKVCMSAGGHYLGTECPNCGPYSRETGYFHSREAAEGALKVWQGGEAKPEARNTEFHGRV